MGYSSGWSGGGGGGVAGVSSVQGDTGDVVLDATDVGAEAIGVAAGLLTTHIADTTAVHGITDTADLYRVGGTDVALADGGTGASDAAGARTALQLGTAALAATGDFEAAGAVATHAGATDPHGDRAYADGLAQGLSPKQSVACATTANITLSGEQTIDGVLTSTSRILVKNQTSALENGIYVTAAGAWARAADMNAAGEIPGAFAFVEAGTVNIGSGWVVASQGPFVLGVTSIPFTQFSGAGQIAAGTGISKSGNTLSIDTATTVDKTTAQTLTNKTLTSPAVTTPTGIVKGDVGLGNVDNTSNATERAATATLTNKRVTKRVATLTDAATVTPDVDSYDGGKLTSLSQTTTIANPSGTPTSFQMYILRIKSSSVRTLSFGTKYRSGVDVTLPSATTGSSKTDYFGFQYNSDDDKWDLLAKATGY